jgi:hypothetical protein
VILDGGETLATDDHPPESRLVGQLEDDLEPLHVIEAVHVLHVHLRAIAEEDVALLGYSGHLGGVARMLAPKHEWIAMCWAFPVDDSP